MKKKVALAAVSLFVLAFLAAGVLAMGVSSPYWDQNPLNLYPGQTENVQLNLQNMVGSDDVTISASITKGSEIASITDASTVYSVPAGTKDT